jgi:hypothetical protein
MAVGAAVAVGGRVGGMEVVAVDTGVAVGVGSATTGPLKSQAEISVTTSSARTSFVEERGISRSSVLARLGLLSAGEGFFVCAGGYVALYEAGVLGRQLF